MTDQEAYRRYTAKAEELLTEAETAATALTPDHVQAYGRLAGAWATLALAAAQERVMPTERPVPSWEPPEEVKDGDGDIWYRHSNGLYAMAGASMGECTLEMIAKANNGYTEVT